MNNMKEATTDAMKETTGKVVNEKEKATTENIETIKKTMENTDGIDPKLPRFLAIWSGFCIVSVCIGLFCRLLDSLFVLCCTFNCVVYIWFYLHSKEEKTCDLQFYRT